MTRKTDGEVLREYMAIQEAGVPESPALLACMIALVRACRADEPRIDCGAHLMDYCNIDDDRKMDDVYGPDYFTGPLEVVPIGLTAADSEFLAAIRDAETAARDHILCGLGVPADVLRGGSYIDTPEVGR